MTFGDYVQALRTFWRSILSVFLVALGIALGVTLLTTETYTASSQVLFTPAGPGATGGQDLASAQQYTQARMVVYQELVTTPQVLGSVVNDLDLDRTPSGLADDVSAEFERASTLLTISVEDESASRAARIVSTVSGSLIDEVGEIETRTNPAAKSTEDPEIQVVTGRLVSDPPDPTDPTSPDLQLNLAAGALLGLILGLAQAGARFLKERSAPAGPAKTKKPQKPKNERSFFGRTPKPAAAMTASAPVAAPQPPPLPPTPPSTPPRTAKPKPQKRPGKRTRR